jgi:hypothetical protein
LTMTTGGGSGGGGLRRTTTATAASVNNGWRKALSYIFIKAKLAKSGMLTGIRQKFARKSSGTPVSIVTGLVVIEEFEWCCDF